MIVWSDAETTAAHIEGVDADADTDRENLVVCRSRGGSSAQLDRPVDWLVQPGEPSRVSLDLRRAACRPGYDSPRRSADLGPSRPQGASGPPRGGAGGGQGRPPRRRGEAEVDPAGHVGACRR